MPAARERSTEHTALVRTQVAAARLITDGAG